MDKFAQLLASVRSDKIGSLIEDEVGQLIQQRSKFERRWYDNNFFDDGFHFRVVSRSTGRVIDTLNKTGGFVERSIPRASRQIRGVTNLLFAAEPFPVIFPQRITVEDFRDPSGQVNIEAYKQASEQAKRTARKQGTWLQNTWEQVELDIKLIDLLLLSAKNSISYMQVYTDSKQKICCTVLDAFDVVHQGYVRSLEELPLISKITAMDIKEVENNPLFKPEMVRKLQPDNKYATSEIKNAFMTARFGSKTTADKPTILLKETFMYEVLNDDNWKDVQSKAQDATMEGKSKGDKVMRHVFSAGGVTLNDEYVDYDEYPFADFRYEPGYMYQTPFIERFIPQNKSVDIIVTRLEKWINTMVTGVYQRRKGENFQISNFPGGQTIDYETTPLSQMQIGSVGNTPFEVIGLMDKYIEEQGASTAALGQLPNSVKSGVAIESLKSTEYANLKIPTMMLKSTIKKIAKLMIERAHKDFMVPQEVSHLQDGEPQYFDVIGKRGMDLSNKVGKPLPPGIVPIDKDVGVRIEIQPGLGLTNEGKKDAMQTILTQLLLPLQQSGALPPDALKIAVKKTLDTYGFGSTQEFMEALDNGGQDMTEEQISQVKVAVLEVLKDADVVGPGSDQKLVDSTKVGVVEALKETGVMDKVLNEQEKTNDPSQKISESINYKDASPQIKRQMETKAGFIPATDDSPSETDQKVKIHQATKPPTQAPVDVVK